MEPHIVGGTNNNANSPQSAVGLRKRFSGVKSSAIVGLVVLAASSGFAQNRPARIFDLELGAHVSRLPLKDFVQPSCGNNGGPQGLAIRSFAHFMECRAESTGLREVWFEYDDTAEFAALARRQPGRHRTTSLLDQPVVLSLLINEGGYVQGYRIVTDTRTEPSLRRHAHEIARHFKARFKLDAYCSESKPEDGETPVDEEFVKESCLREQDGFRIHSIAQFFHRAGQKPYDVNTGVANPNAFESSARLEVLRSRETSPLIIQSIKPANADISEGPEIRFMTGLATDCPGCDLVEADLRYRDLSNANLEGANLEGALLHRARLVRANLRGANLNGANLNRANISFADLRGARVVNAMLFQTDAQGSDIRDADLSRSMMGRANLSFAKLEQSKLDHADLGAARLTDAIMSRTSLVSTYFPQAIMLRTRLEGAQAVRANFSEARLRGANLTNANLQSADLSSADLTDTDMTLADFAGARLAAADMSGAKTSGAHFLNAIMPDKLLRR